jgi:hypothetical protein
VRSDQDLVGIQNWATEFSLFDWSKVEPFEGVGLLMSPWESDVRHCTTTYDLPINDRIKSVQPQRFPWLIVSSVSVPWDNDPCWYVSVAFVPPNSGLGPKKQVDRGVLNVNLRGAARTPQKGASGCGMIGWYDMGISQNGPSVNSGVCRGCFAYVWTDGVADCQCRWGAPEQKRKRAESSRGAQCQPKEMSAVRRHQLWRFWGNDIELGDGVCSFWRMPTMPLECGTWCI